MVSPWLDCVQAVYSKCSISFDACISWGTTFSPACEPDAREKRKMDSRQSWSYFHQPDEVQFVLNAQSVHTMYNDCIHSVHRMYTGQFFTDLQTDSYMIFAQNCTQACLLICSQNVHTMYTQMSTCFLNIVHQIENNAAQTLYTVCTEKCTQ